MKKTLIFIVIATLLFAPLFSKTSREEKNERVFEMVEDESEIITANALKMELFKNTNLYKATRGDDNENLLIVALKFDRDYEIIKLLLDAEIDVDYKTKSGKTALMYAARHSSNIEVVEMILKNSSFFSSKRKKRISATDSNGQDSYDYAAKNEMPGMREEIFELFSKYVPIPEKYQNLPSTIPSLDIPEEVEESAASPLEESVEKTIEEIETPSETLPEEVEEIEEVEEVETPPEEIKEAEAESAQSEPAPPSSIVPQKDETQTNLVKAIEAIKNIEVEEKSEYLYDYADYDSRISRGDVGRTFIENVNARDENGRTLLMKAAKNGDINQIKDLLYSGAAVDVGDNDGWTALMFAARYQKNPEAVNVLLESGANFRRKNNFGVTALMIAAGFNKEPSVTAALLENRAATETDVRASFMHAVQSGASISVLEEFKKRGISLNTPFYGKTALMYAAESNADTKTISWLLQNGAEREAITADGMTAFDYANANTKIERDDVFWSLSFKNRFGGKK